MRFPFFFVFFSSLKNIRISYRGGHNPNCIGVHSFYPQQRLPPEKQKIYIMTLYGYMGLSKCWLEVIGCYPKSIKFAWECFSHKFVTSNPISTSGLFFVDEPSMCFSCGWETQSVTLVAPWFRIE